MTTLRDGFLTLTANSLDDLEGLRISTENRLRALTRTEEDKDGEVRGLGLNILSKEVANAQALLEGIKKLEHSTTLELQRAVRKHPLYDWVKREKGVGEKQAARLLSSIGDPYWNDLYDRPRTVSELWAYCGYSVNGATAQRRTKGVKSNWSSEAKMRAFLMAESCVKTKGNYRKVYDEARDHYTGATHQVDCVRCGPSGKPALAGTPLSAGHQHARALRLVAKQILQDVWIESKTIHEKAENSPS